MRILVVRLSALGDVVHTLPALTDLRRAFPQATIEVATDERFVDIPQLHAGVDAVRPIALKRWKRHLRERRTWQELAAAARELRGQPYDLVIDLHGLTKSALVTWLVRSPLKLGPAPAFCGEWLAPRLYHRHLDSQGVIMPVPRMRRFMAQAIGRPCEGAADYGLQAQWSGQASRQVALIHSTADENKLWPEAHWIALGQALAAQGLDMLIPWGGPHEHERAQRLAEGIGASHCRIGAKQSIAQWTRQLSACRLVVGVDTGLVHLAAAAGVPCLALFTATGAALFAPQKPERCATLGDVGQVPAPQQAVAQALGLLAATAHMAGTSASAGGASSQGSVLRGPLAGQAVEQA